MEGLGLKNDHVIKLIEALEKNKSVKSLILRFNNVNDEGASSIAKFLLKNTTIKYLDLTKNTISDKGACELANAINCNKTLLMF